MTSTPTAVVIGTNEEAENGALADRVLRIARQDHMVAIALRAFDGYCVVLLASAPSLN